MATKDMPNGGEHVELSHVDFLVLDYAVLGSTVPFLKENSLDVQFSARKDSNPESNVLSLILNLELTGQIDEESLQNLRGDEGEIHSFAEESDMTRVGFMTVQVSFEVGNFEVLRDEEGRLSVPGPMVIEMLSIGYNGLRGAWAAESAGTQFGDSTLPVVDIEKLASHLFDWIEREQAKEE